MQQPWFMRLTRPMPNAQYEHTSPSRTSSLLFKTDNPLPETAGGAGGASSLDGLKRLDENWEKLKKGGWKNQPEEIVFTKALKAGESNISVSASYDVVISGGTLGIFYAAALQKKGKAYVYMSILKLTSSQLFR